MLGQKLNFHHDVAALDGKHVTIRCPRQSGSWYNNYKGFHSVVMLAFEDSDYKFLLVDMGNY